VGWRWGSLHAQQIDQVWVWLCALQIGRVARSYSNLAAAVRFGGSGKSGGGSKVWRQRHLSGHRCVMQACRVLMELHGHHRTAKAGDADA